MAGPVHLTLCYRLQAPANWVPRRSAVAGECAASATRRTLSEELADAILTWLGPRGQEAADRADRPQLLVRSGRRHRLGGSPGWRRICRPAARSACPPRLTDAGPHRRLRCRCQRRSGHSSRISRAMFTSSLWTLSAGSGGRFKLRTSSRIEPPPRRRRDADSVQRRRPRLRLSRSMGHPHGHPRAMR